MAIILTFEKNKDADVEAIFHTCRLLKDKHYLSNGFIPTTNLVPGLGQFFYLPDLDYMKYDGYWDAVISDDPVVIKSVKEFISVEICTIAYSSEGLDQFLEQLEDYWKTHEYDLKRFVYTIEPTMRECNISISVNAKTFGMIYDFNTPKLVPGKLSDHRISIRKDTSPQRFSSAFLATLLSDKISEKYGWWEKKAILDVHNEIFHKSFSKEVPEPGFFDYLYQKVLDKDILENSQEFRRKNKLLEPNMFSLTDDERVLLSGKPLVEKYTHVEMRILKAFLKNPSGYLSYEELSELMWRREAAEKYSLTAMSKRIERLRIKLTDEGLKHSVIRSIKGQGYYMAR
jgi:DNA-binding winged helix-turn-helix (wHTH) protein